MTSSDQPPETDKLTEEAAQQISRLAMKIISESIAQVADDIADSLKGQDVSAEDALRAFAMTIRARNEREFPDLAHLDNLQ